MRSKVALLFAIVLMFGTLVATTGVMKAEDLLEEEYVEDLMEDEGDLTEDLLSIGSTNIVGDVSPSDSGLVYWGGGTLLQLASRMSKSGCDVSEVHTFSYYNSSVDYRVWHSYYFDPDSSKQTSKNKGFLKKYGEDIPEGLLSIVCGEEFDFVEDEEDLFGCDSSTASWSKVVVDNVFSRIGTFGEECVVFFNDEDEVEDLIGVRIRFPSQYFSFFSYIRDDSGELELQDDVFMPMAVIILYHDDYEYNKVFSEVYETCRLQQDWYVYHTRLHSKYNASTWWEVWEKTEAGREFIRLFRWKMKDGEWHLPSTSIFRSFNADSPFSLATEICQIYFLDDMYRDLDFGWYLPSSVVEWVEEYIAVLPD